MGADGYMTRKVERSCAEPCASIGRMDDAVAIGLSLLDAGEKKVRHIIIAAKRVMPQQPFKILVVHHTQKMSSSTNS